MNLKHLGTVVGTAIAGMFVMSVWGQFVTEYGIVGGWFAGFIIIGTMWMVNHYVGIHCNDGSWVDMALGIGVAGYARGMFEQGIQAGIDSLPTLSLVLLGGMLGGYVAILLENHLKEEKAKAEAEA